MLEGVQGVNVVFLCFFLSLYLKIQEFETRCFSSSGALDKENCLTQIAHGPLLCRSYFSNDAMPPYPVLAT